MNKKQKAILITAVIGIILMTLFPPMSYDVYGVTGEATVFGGYNFIGTLETRGVGDLSPILQQDIIPKASLLRIEPVRLTLQFIGTFLSTGLLLVAFHTNKEHD